MRWAHRGVWCSKVHRLIEAELFAAESERPAPSGRALSCAAVNARKIQGSSATYKLKNARNRAPVTPVSPRDQRESRRKGGFGGVKRGQGNHMVPLPPLAPAGGHRHLRRQTAAPPGRRRRPLCTLTLSVNLASSGAPLYRRRGLPSAEGERKNEAAAMRHISRCANREVGFSSKNVAFSLALCTQHTV